MYTEHFFDDKKFILDFDSCVIQKEALDELATLALAELPPAIQHQILTDILETTRLGMEGQIRFGESLRRRMLALQGLLTLPLVMNLADSLPSYISDFFLAHKAFFETKKDDVYIVSGGFEEMIRPTARILGIAEDHIFANQFVTQQDQIIGYNSNNPLAQDNGKAAVVRKLNFRPEQVIVIGDGSTDRKIKETGLANYFFAFVENINRPGIESGADGTQETLAHIIALSYASPATDFLRTDIEAKANKANVGSISKNVRQNAGLASGSPTLAIDH